ncbi:MAG: PepSY domain-containing protein [Alphaproteobacteria bacterium]
MRGFLITVSVLCFALPAYAQEITVIQDDGTKVTVPLEPIDAVLPGEIDAPPAQAAPVPPADKKLHVEEVAPRPYVDRIVEPPQRVYEDAPAPAPKKKGKAEKSKHPKPPRVPTQKAVKNSIGSMAPGTEITERMATSIAFDAAPASSGFTASRQSYEGRPVYVVTFKTDDGPYDVLVDAASGEVVVSAYVETHEQKATAPGHLPADWEPYAPQPVGRPQPKP